MKSHRLLVLLPLLLSGCASDEHQDLRQWMRDEAKGMKGKVAPLPEITPFPVVSYETEMLTPPFATGKIVTLEVAADKTAPDRERPQQPPPPNKPKHVRVGEYMGRNFGKITAITSEGITVVETVKDANGAWVTQEKLLIVPKEGGRR